MKDKVEIKKFKRMGIYDWFKLKELENNAREYNKFRKLRGKTVMKNKEVISELEMKIRKKFGYEDSTIISASSDDIAYFIEQLISDERITKQDKWLNRPSSLKERVKTYTLIKKGIEANKEMYNKIWKKGVNNEQSN